MPAEHPGPGVAAAARKPRAYAYVNGLEVPRLAIREFAVNTNSFYQADTFHLELALSALPAEFDAAYWSVTDDIGVQIKAGFQALEPPGNPNVTLDLLFSGMVDEVDVDWVERCVTLTGRDLTGVFIDTETSEHFPEMTASQIVAELAARHGIAAKVTPTVTKAGRYYEREHVKLTREMREWDLITFLAGMEGFVVWMDGETLRFEPAPSPDGDPYRLHYKPPADDGHAEGNFIRLNSRRNLTLARDIVVQVRAWNQKQAAGFTKTFRAVNAHRSQRAGGKAQVFSFTLPNATLEQVIRFGQQKLAELTRHERLIEFEQPAEPSSVINMATTVALTGTGTDFDQQYFPDSIVRRMTPRGGYRMTVRAKNHSPNSEVTV